MTFGVILLLMLVAFGNAESAVGVVTFCHSGFRAVDVEPVLNTFFRIGPEDRIVTDSIDIWFDEFLYSHYQTGDEEYEHTESDSDRGSLHEFFHLTSSTSIFVDLDKNNDGFMIT